MPRVYQYFLWLCCIEKPGESDYPDAVGFWEKGWLLSYTLEAFRNETI